MQNSIRYAAALILLSFICLILMPRAALSKMKMKTGLWEFSSKISMPGMPMSMPTVKNKKCLTREDIIPKTESPNQNCTITNKKMSGDTVSYDITCKTSSNTTKGHAEITYKWKSMNGTMDMVFSPGDTKMKMKIEGKYLDACK